MINYAISDLHLDHPNIIDKCNRPFDSVEEMNQTLIQNWNNTVSEDETILFLGDLAMARKDRQKELYNKLNGNIIFIKGNHDDLTMQSGIGLIYDGIEFNIKGIPFYATHKPLNTANSYRWILHGHTHNDDLQNNPFYNPAYNSINVSAELINYKPISITEIINTIRNNNTKIKKYKPF